MNLIEQNKNAIAELCKLYKVEELLVFGSILTDKFRKDSDVDFLIKFGAVDPFNYFDNYKDIKEALEKLLQRPVDLL